MQSPVLCVYKPISKTPLEVITKVKEHYPELRDEKVSYAGRLDPMADGLLLILIGEENKKRKEYESLPKSYLFSFVLGVSTDSYDLLGKITKTDPNPPLSLPQLTQVFTTFPGKRLQAYPPYSSKPVNGKPLYYWARNNKIDTITIPEKHIEIYEATLKGQTTITMESLRESVRVSISALRGDFRQEGILNLWEQYFTHSPKAIPLITGSLTCSSGTYVRGIVHEIGEMIGTPTTTTSITRTAVGSFTLTDAIRLPEL